MGEEETAVSSILRELMERDVLDEATRRKMEQDGERIQRRLRDPAATMEARHQQVRVPPPTTPSLPPVITAVTDCSSRCGRRRLGGRPRGRGSRGSGRPRGKPGRRRGGGSRRRRRGGRGRRRSRRSCCSRRWRSCGVSWRRGSGGSSWSVRGTSRAATVKKSHSAGSITLIDYQFRA